MNVMTKENQQLKSLYVEMRMRNDLLKKPLRPFQLKELAEEAVQRHDVNIALVCRTFQISTNCYLNEYKVSDGNTKIADWLVWLTADRRSWSFGQYVL